MARLISFLLLLGGIVNAYHIWENAGALPTTIPAGCRAALSQNLTCTGGLITGKSLSSGRLPDIYTLSDYCKPECLSSLQTYKKNVDLRCGNTAYQMYTNGSFQTGPSIADPLVWAYNTSCLRDEVSFCLPAIRNGSAKACSSCALRYGAAMLNSDYGRQRIQPAPFSSLLSSCKVPASSYTYTYTPTSSSGTTSASSLPTCTGKTYTATADDTCQSIAESQSIATDRLVAANSLTYNCTDLSAGSELCIESTCALHTVQAGETCSDVASGKGFSIVQLTSWNPTIHTNCDNLDSMVGRSICVSPPGTSSYDESSMTISPSSTITRMFTGPYTTGSFITNPPEFSTPWFNTETNFTAPPTQTVTYNATEASLADAISTLCPISPSDADNGWVVADLPDACQTLLDPYCYPDLSQPSPTSRRFPAVCSPAYYSTSTSASATATGSALPSPIQPGTVSSCRSYYKVMDGDTCYSITTHFNVSLDDFYKYNPKVGTDCTGLLLGYYVCLSA